MRERWSRYWPVDLLAVGVLILVFLFGAILTARERATVKHNEQQRQALCAILDRIPEHVNAGIDQARRLDRCGHPRPPIALLHPPASIHPTVRKTVIITPPGSERTVTTVETEPAQPPRPSGTTSSRSPAPRPTRTRSPSPAPSPTPSPSPSSVCVVTVCIPQQR